MDVIRVFLGFDPRETIAFHVACHSIHRHCSRPVSIAPLMLSQLGAVFQRPRDPKQSTDFSFTRFLVPFLCDYSGWSLFVDCDVLFSADLARLWDLRDDRYAVQVVQHEHLPAERLKFLGHEQTRYAKKNWSSLMLFNNARCRGLTPEYVQEAPGLSLHQFAWLEDESLIGALPRQWNHLVDHQAPLRPGEPVNLHFTTGGPWFETYRHCLYADAWWDELRRTLEPVSVQGWPRLPVPDAAAALRAA